MIVYSTKNCPACIKLKAELTKRKIKFENVFMEDLDPQEQLKIMKKAGTLSVPLIEKEGRFITEREICPK